MVLLNREAAGSTPMMREYADEWGERLLDCVQCDELDSKYGHGVFSLDGEL